MTTFTNGPAMGKILFLQRAPMFLRVVADGNRIAALDLVTDQPADTATIHVYRRVGDVFHAHVHRAGGKGGWYQGAAYEIHSNRPEESILRDQAHWQQWCQTEAERTGV